jgi:hypothetical protein
MKPGNFDNIEKWRTQLLHTSGNESNRRLFWYNVIKTSLRLLNTDDARLLKKWVHLDKSTTLHTLSNSQINNTLKSILHQYIRAFFEHPAFATFINCSVSGQGLALPFLFIIDEAAYLYQTNYMHAVMWVLDQTVVDIVNELKLGTNFFVLMLGTHSQISHFAPDYAFPSQRYFDQSQFIPSIFLSLSWDSGVVFRPKNRVSLDESSYIQNLVTWGRASWLALYKGLKGCNEKERLRQCIFFAIKKLLPPVDDPSDSDKLLSMFGVLALRLHLDFDFVFPSRANKLVSSKMRWLVDVDSWRKHLVTTYGSEPVLVEAAACIMNSHLLVKNKANPLPEFVENLELELSLGHVNRGSNGELTARLLRIQPFRHF